MTRQCSMKTSEALNILINKRSTHVNVTHARKNEELKLNGMVKAFEEQSKSSSYSKLSFEERLGHLVEQEALDRDNRKLSTRLKSAKLKHDACVENLDFKSNRKLERGMVLSLSLIHI